MVKFIRNLMTSAVLTFGLAVTILLAWVLYHLTTNRICTIPWPGILWPIAGLFVVVWVLVTLTNEWAERRWNKRA